MRIVVIGAGKVGREVCRELADKGHDISLIDNDDSVLREAENFIDIKTVQGNGEIAQVQREAGVERADIVIAVTEYDQTNILCCMIAKSLGVASVVARVRDYDLYKQASYMSSALGIDMFVNPEYETALSISRNLRYPSAMQVDYSDRAHLDIVSMEVNEDNELCGKALADIGKITKQKVLICAVSRDDEVIVPNGSFVFSAGDVVYLTGLYLNIDGFFRRCGLKSTRVKSIMTVGGGRIAWYLSELLHDSGIDITIVDPDEAVCSRLSAELSYVSVLRGDGTDKRLLAEAGVQKMDALIALTGNDETNIVVSLYAKNMSLSKVIAKINNHAFDEVANTLGISHVVTPKNIASISILKFVKKLAFKSQNMLGYYPLFNGATHAVVCIVDDEKVDNMLIRDIALKQSLLIAGIIKGGVPSIPDGDTKLHLGDTVLVISTDENLRKFGDILI